jgi:hypothetical protein
MFTLIEENFPLVVFFAGFGAGEPFSTAAAGSLLAAVFLAGAAGFAPVLRFGLAFLAPALAAGLLLAAAFFAGVARFPPVLLLGLAFLAPAFFELFLTAMPGG